MDEREHDLQELVGYGNRLLTEINSPDADKINMLREVITHISDIAREYAKEAASWQGKYEANKKTLSDIERKINDSATGGDKEAMMEICASLKKIKKAVKKIGKKKQ